MRQRMSLWLVLVLVVLMTSGCDFGIMRVGVDPNVIDWGSIMQEFFVSMAWFFALLLVIVIIVGYYLTLARQRGL